MNFVHPQLLHQIQGVAKLRLGFAGKAYDDVGAKGCAGNGPADFVYQVDVVLAGIVAAHPGQYLIIAGLHREVDVFADLGQLRHRFDNAAAHIIGMGGQKPDTVQPVNGVQASQQSS